MRKHRTEPPHACCAADGDDVQDALMDVTGRRTVPQVFIGSKFVGGCDGESPTSTLKVLCNADQAPALAGPRAAPAS